MNLGRSLIRIFCPNEADLDAWRLISSITHVAFVHLPQFQYGIDLHFGEIHLGCKVVKKGTDRILFFQKRFEGRQLPIMLRRFLQHKQYFVFPLG